MTRSEYTENFVLEKLIQQSNIIPMQFRQHSIIGALKVCFF
jgi:hypothetical protein